MAPRTVAPRTAAPRTKVLTRAALPSQTHHAPEGSGSGHDGNGPDDGGRSDERGPIDDAPADDALDSRTAGDDPTAAAAEDGPEDGDGDAGGGELLTVPDPRAGVVREGIVEVRLRLSTALGLDDMPAQVPGWGTVLAGTARELLDRHRHASGGWSSPTTTADCCGCCSHAAARHERRIDQPAPTGPKTGGGPAATPLSSSRLRQRCWPPSPPTTTAPGPRCCTNCNADSPTTTHPTSHPTMR